MTTRGISGSWLVVLFAAGCGPLADPGPDPLPTPESSPTTLWGQPDVIARLPAPPDLGPCPSGWIATPDAEHPSIVTCDPWAGQGRQRCDGATAQFPGEDGCVPLGGACPEDGAWPADLPDEGVLFVSAEGPADGDGSRARPFPTIAVALGRVGRGAVIALAAGTYDEALFLGRSVTIRGACAERTILTAAPSDEWRAAVHVEGASDVVLQDLTIRADRIGVYAIDSEGVRLEGVVVDHPKGYGVFVADATVDAREVIVRDVAIGGPSAGSIGIETVDGADVTLERASIERPGTLGLSVAFDGSHMTARDVVVHGYGPERTDGRATGMEVVDGASAALERVVFDGLGGSGVNVARGATLTATDLVVTDTDTCEDGQWGNAVTAWGEGTSAQLDKTWIARARETAITASRGAEIEATDVVVADTLPPRASDTGALLGYGVETIGASVALTRVAILRSHGPAIGVGPHPSAPDPTHLDATDVSVLGEGRGYGLQADGDDTRVTLDRVRFTGSRESTIFALLGARIDGGDVTVEDLVPGSTTYPFARAVEVIDDATAELEGLSVRGAVGVALYANGGDLSLRRVDVRATTREVCAEDDASGGYGVLATAGGTLEMRDFRIAGADLCGLILDTDDAVLQHGAVVDNEIGACLVGLEDEGAFMDRVRRLVDDVVWDNRGPNITSDQPLVLPTPSEPMPMSPGN